MARFVVEGLVREAVAHDFELVFVFEVVRGGSNDGG